MKLRNRRNFVYVAVGHFSVVYERVTLSDKLHVVAACMHGRSIQKWGGDEVVMSKNGGEGEIKLIQCVKIKMVRLPLRQRPTKQEAFLTFCSPLSFLQSNFLPPSSLRCGSSVYSFFFSFCLSSLLISLLAMDAYLEMTPCWFRPGSSSRKLTSR